MVTQLLEKERIRTTLAKAKTLQRYTDKVITLGKKVRGVARPRTHPVDLRRRRLYDRANVHVQGASS